MNKVSKILVTASVCAAFALSASAAQAWQQVGPCRLHAFVPTVSGSIATFDAKVDTCGGFGRQLDMSMQVCPQARVQLNWIQGGCDTIPVHHALSLEDRFRARISGRPNALREWVWAKVRVGRRWYQAAMYSGLRKV